jgi:hypothetical protein
MVVNQKKKKKKKKISGSPSQWKKAGVGGAHLSSQLQQKV